MNHAQSSRAVFIHLARREMLSWQSEYRRAKAELNVYTNPVCKSVSWWIFNKTRHNYLQAMARLRAALKVTA